MGVGFALLAVLIAVAALSGFFFLYLCGVIGATFLRVFVLFFLGGRNFRFIHGLYLFGGEGLLSYGR